MRPSDFSKRAYGHQRRLDLPVDTTDAIYKEAKALFREVWKGEPGRNLGVYFNEIADSKEGQLSMFGNGLCGGPGDGTAGESEKAEELDKTVDMIRERFGKDALKRGV
jgi:DNA polymerase-4